MTQQPYLQKDLGGHWRTIYPNVIEDFFDDYWNAVEIMENQPRKAEEVFKKIISNCGNGHIDAILHLGFLYNETGRRIEGNALIHKAHNIALQALPKDFNPNYEEIHWGHVDNRPLLRTFHAAGLEYMNEQQYEKAIEKFNFLLNINPGDNQGVGYLLQKCLLLSTAISH